MEDDDPQLNDHPDINDPNPEDPENPGGMFLYLYHSVKLLFGLLLNLTIKRS